MRTSQEVRADPGERSLAGSRPRRLSRSRSVCLALESRPLTVPTGHCSCRAASWLVFPSRQQRTSGSRYRSGNWLISSRSSGMTAGSGDSAGCSVLEPGRVIYRARASGRSWLGEPAATRRATRCSQGAMVSRHLIVFAHLGEDQEDVLKGVLSVMRFVENAAAYGEDHRTVLLDDLAEILPGPSRPQTVPAGLVRSSADALPWFPKARFSAAKGVMHGPSTSRPLPSDGRESWAIPTGIRPGCRRATGTRSIVGPAQGRQGGAGEVREQGRENQQAGRSGLLGQSEW